MNYKEYMSNLNKKLASRGYYLIPCESDNYRIKLFKTNKKRNVYSLKNEYIIEDNKTETLEELELEILKDIEVIENGSSRDKR